MKLKILNSEIVHLLGGEQHDFPKYTTQLMNLANSNAGGTRPKVVGQMSDLIQEFDGKTLTEWIYWYSERKPNSVSEAANKIMPMIELLKAAIAMIDRPMVEKWIRDLVHNKTFAGLRFQEAILKKVSEKVGKTYRLSVATEEAKGIDGFIGNEPVSIKPHTYRSKEGMLGESIDISIIYYEKKKDGIVIETDF